MHILFDIIIKRIYFHVYSTNTHKYTHMPAHTHTHARTHAHTHTRARVVMLVNNLAWPLNTIVIKMACFLLFFLIEIEPKKDFTTPSAR